MNRKLDIIFAILSGILLVISFPTISFTFLAWVALVPLLIALQKKDLPSAGKLGLVTGFVYFYGILYWLNVLSQFDSIMPLATIVLSLILSLYVVVFAILLVWLSEKYKNSLWIITPILWTTLEYIRGLGPLGFPWGLLGYSQASNLNLIQISSITGVLGITFLILLCNGITSQLIFEWRQHKKLSPGILFLLIGLVVMLGMNYMYGSHRMQQPSTSNRITTIAIVQGNIPQEMKWDDAKELEHFNKYINLTQKVLPQNPSLIVWPETAVTDYISENTIYRNQLVTLATSNRINLLFGTLDDNYPEPERVFYNAVYLVEPNGDMSQKYNKTHLVPFGEYLPLEATFPSLKNLNLVPSHFTPGNDLTLFHTTMDSTSINLSCLVCFESIVPSIARAMVNRSAQFLVIVTNDSWFGRTAAPYEHADIARFRAIETGVPIVRAANTGYSCFIDKRGRVLKALDIYQTGTLTQNLPIEDHPSKTFYLQYGDWLPLLCGIILLLLIASHAKSIYSKNT